MKLLCSLLFLSVYFTVSGVHGRHKGINGGIPCAGCTFAVGLVEQLAQVHNVSVTQAVDDVCALLPSGGYKEACRALIDRYGPIVIDLLYVKATPDIICNSIGFCRTDPGKPFCHLWPLPKNHTPHKTWAHSHADGYFTKRQIPVDLDICDIPGIKFICSLYDKVFTNHIPLVDIDKDGFSTVETFRGTSWRGKDCSFDNKSIYPGARPVNSDIEEDSNCNGIYGVNSAGVPYEDLLCGRATNLGVGLLGDSAGAHFHIPPEWLRADILTKDILTHLSFVVENEFDWPHMSAYTGYVNITWPIIHGPVQSMYTKLLERNRCNHRDYQNLGVNGANSSDIQRYQLGLSRNQTADYPMVMFYALVGNDVCNGYPDTVAHMTTREKMRSNVHKTFEYLDTKLPAGSHIIIMGLADGRVLYNNMHARYHPFGTVNKDLKYSQFYDFLSCLEISPCNGWMTTNDTLREITWQRVEELNLVLKDFAHEYQTHYKNFDIIYLECPLMPVLKEYERKHGRGTGWQLIELVDGFHPNQYALELSALYVWDYLERYHPNFLGDRNPHNDEIRNIFGDQGGY